AIDLKSDQGRELVMKLLPECDIVVENFAPGVLERLGFGYEALKAANPAIILGQIKGFGSTGPYADYKSFDATAQAAAGVFSTTGERDGPPIYPGTTLGDSGTGVQLGMALLAAYIQRLRTGEGQCVEISMQEAVTYFMRTRICQNETWGGKAVPRNGSNLGVPPIGLYPCKPFGPNDYIYLFATTDGQWDMLCVLTDNPELLADERYMTPQGRLKHREPLVEALSEWTRSKTKFEAMQILGEAGVPCSAVLDTKELHENEHLRERGFVQDVELPVHGKVPMLGFAPRLSASEVAIEPAPRLGEHTRDVLARELNLSEADLDALQEQGVIGHHG
ncbi:MAG: CoA transferase, partial [Pseudomonadota bacterium]